MRVERFEDLIAWQKARDLNRAVSEASNRGPFARNFALRDQISRAAVSVMANIAEGFERTGSGEFEHALSIAKGSCAEVRSHLYAAFDMDCLDEPTFVQLRQQAEELSRIIAGLRAAVHRSRH